MQRILILSTSGIFWLIMMLMLFKREIIPYFEYQASPSYRTIIRNKASPEFMKRSIYILKEKVGESLTLIEPESKGMFTIHSQFNLKIKDILANLLPLAGAIQISSIIRLDPMYNLVEFKSRASLFNIITKITGYCKGDHMYFDYSAGNIKGSDKLEIPKGALLISSLSSTENIGKPYIGKKWKYQMIDFDIIITAKPKFTTAYAQVESRESIKYLGNQIMAYRIEIKKDLSKTMPMITLWADDDGEVLIEEFPLLKTTCTVILEEKKKINYSDLPSYSKFFIYPYD